MWTERADDPEKEIRDARQWIFDRMLEGGFIDE
jgi:L-ribulose-5-phosphate 3-epimerase UlaE